MYSALIPSFYAFFFTMIVYLIHINHNETTHYLNMPKIRELIEELNNKKTDDGDCVGNQVQDDYVDNWGKEKDKSEEVRFPVVEKPELTDEENALNAFKETDKYKYLTKYELTKTDKDLCNLEKNNTDLVYEYNPILKTIVIMGYDFKYEYFTYWADLSIPFYYLNVIAIKYVNEYNRSHLFSKHKIIEEEQQEEENDEESVFIKVENNEKRLEKRFINNHFKHCGHLRELKVVKLHEKKSKDVDFKSFSEMFTGEDINLTRRRDRSP